MLHRTLPISTIFPPVYNSLLLYPSILYFDFFDHFVEMFGRFSPLYNGTPSILEYRATDLIEPRYPLDSSCYTLQCFSSDHESAFAFIDFLN